MNFDPIVDVPTAAVSVGVTASTVRRWLAGKQLEPVTTGPAMVRCSDVERVRAERRAAQMAELDRGRRIAHNRTVG